jgi:hypothetical protein
VQGQLNKVEDKIIDDLKNASIEFTNQHDLPVVSLSFETHGDAIQVNYSVYTERKILQKGSFRVEEHERDMAGKLIAYRLFGIQKTKTGEQPPAAPVKEEKGEKHPA